jgi:hypothetical protein
MLDHELRPGKQHCQEGTPEFIGECVEKHKTSELKGSCLIRLDQRQRRGGKLVGSLSKPVKFFV